MFVFSVYDCLFYFILFVFNIKIKYKKILINQLYNNDNLI